MKKGIRTLSRVVQDLPRTTTNMQGPTKAALLFNIPRQVFPTNNDRQWQLLTQLLDKSQELKTELNNLPDNPSMSPIIGISVNRVLSDDDDKRQIIAQQTTDSVSTDFVSRDFHVA